MLKVKKNTTTKNKPPNQHFSFYLQIPYAGLEKKGYHNSFQWPSILSNLPLSKRAMRGVFSLQVKILTPTTIVGFPHHFLEDYRNQSPLSINPCNLAVCFQNSYLVNRLKKPFQNKRILQRPQKL